MKKITVLITAVMLILSGCAQPKNADGKISIVCTVFPQYDWVRELISGTEDKYELTLLTEKGVDIHSYQPSADDIIKINTSNLIIYTGGESDKWIKDYTKGINKSVDMLDIVGSDALYDNEEKETDEHTWLSLSNAEKICEKITEALISLDPENEALYKANEENYDAELDKLDAEYERAAESAVYKTVVVADRFPFRYLFDEYNIEHFAAFPGCSAETEASFETVKLLSEKAESVPAVIVTDNGNEKLAKTVISNTSDKEKPIISLNSMQSVKREDIDGGVTYLSVMKDNLAALKKALGE